MKEKKKYQVKCKSAREQKWDWLRKMRKSKLLVLHSNDDFELRNITWLVLHLKLNQRSQQTDKLKRGEKKSNPTKLVFFRSPFCNHNILCVCFLSHCEIKENQSHFLYTCQTINPLCRPQSRIIIEMEMEKNKSNEVKEF